jgi:hypothetical protein
MRDISFSLVQDNDRVRHPVLATTRFTRLVLAMDDFDMDLFSLDHGLERVRRNITNRDCKFVLLLDHVLAIVELGPDLKG